MPSPSQAADFGAPLSIVAPLILAFGDSLTEGYGLLRHESFAAQVEAMLQPDLPGARVINAGLSGDTTRGALRRLPRLLSGLTARPNLAIVEFGANDLFQGIPLTETRANLDRIVTELKRCGIPVLLAAMEAPPLLGHFGESCNAIYPELAKAHGVPHRPFFPPGVLGAAGLTLRDRIHPNAEGTRRIACAFVPAVVAALAAGRDAVAA